MGSDIVARENHEQSCNQEAESAASHSMQQESRHDGERRGRVIGGKGEIAATCDQKIGDATVISVPAIGSQSFLVCGRRAPAGPNDQTQWRLGRICGVLWRAPPEYATISSLA